MDALLLIAIEADREARRKLEPVEPVCKMAGSVDDITKVVANIAQSVSSLKRDILTVGEVASDARDAANKAAAKKAPKAKDYVMEVVRDEKEKITRIDVRAV